MKVEHSEKNLLMQIANGFRVSRGIRKNLDGEALVELANQVVESKLPQVVDGTVTEITAEDLAGATQIKDYAFWNCSGLTGVTIPNSVTSVGTCAFSGCSGLRSVTIGNSVTIIGQQAFVDCSSLRSVTIGSSVRSIAHQAFETCSSLTSVTIPDSVRSIGDWALCIGSSTNKATITFLRTTPASIASEAFDAFTLEKIIVPKGCGEAYKNATNWANFADYIEEAAE